MKLIKDIEKKFSNTACAAMIIAIAIALVFFKTNFQTYVVPSESMLPTLSIGEVIFGKNIDDVTDIQRGDIVMFDTEYDVFFVKRLIGMSGDTIEIKDGVLYLNGEPQIEEYVNNDGIPMSDFGPYTVPEGHYFMMGDNRNNSGDSRVIGPIAFEDIRSKALFHYPAILRKLFSN